MNFSGDGSEEVRGLKKKVQQQDFRLAHLQGESKKQENELTTLRDEIKSLKQSCNAGESRIVQLETENVKIKEDRDRQKLANSNLEQTLHQTKVQLQSTEKEKRLLNNDTERNLERKARMAEEDAEAARQRCRTLEEQLKSAQASDRFHDTGRGSDSDAKVLSLQSQVNALTTSLQQYQTSSPASIRAGGPSRRPRSSSMSGSSSSAIHAMKESLDETTKEVEQWRTRATKAEREALQASNEKLAHSRLTNTTIADLRSQVADLKDELSFQRDNTLKNLEDEVRSLRGDSVKAATLGVDLTAARSSITQQEAALKAAQETIDTMQGTADQLQAELKRSKEDAVQMKEQLVIAEQISNLLQRRDREIASAQKRIRKLTVALRKIFMSMTNGQAAGDETQSQSMLVMDESSFAIVANSNEYEANWTDELDQLVGYVDEAESRVEFARIEKDIRESNAASRLQELEKIIRAKEEELVLITKDRDCCMDEQEITQARLRETESKKAEVDLKLQDALEKIQNISSDSAVLQENIESLRHELSAAERDLKSNAEDKLAMFHTVSDLKQSQEEIRKQLAESEADTLRAQIDSRSLQGRITSLTEELQALQSRLSTDEQERDGLMRQVHELESHKDSLASQYNEARDTIDKLEQRYQEVELRAASLALESHQMELRLCEEVRQSSQQQADLLEKSSEALHMEGEQWKGLVAELRDEVKQSLLQLQMKERIWIEEADCYSTQVAALETQVNMAREELQERNAQIDVLQLDLQAERTNQQLAEDALKRLVPGRENDLTVVEDASMLDASNEVYELRLQLDQARDALESSKRKQSARESDLAVAMEDAEELRAEVDKLEMQLSEALREKHDVATQGQDLQAKLAAAEHLNREVEVSMAHLNENLSSTMRQLAATQNTVGELEGSVQALETEKNDQMQQFEAAKEELREAQEGYSQLKEMMESRNAEYWETKEELAEWQERFERSQNDVKIKDEIEERLRDAMTELQDSKALAEEYLAKCTALQDSLIAAQKEIEETRSRYSTLEAELEQSRMQATRLDEVDEQLSAATALIEQLEQDLAQKAQECEDADDKELALRKDNKKLGARVAALQARLDKLQLQASTAAKAVTAPLQGNRSPVGIRESNSGGSLSSAVPSTVAPSSASRKRRAPEDEEQTTKSQSHPAVTTRAIYAPKSATSLVKEVAATKAPQQVERIVVKKASFPPSEVLSSRLTKSPKKLQDRTNLLQPRSNPTAGQDSLLTKLNRFRPPPAINIETSPVAPS